MKKKKINLLDILPFFTWGISVLSVVVFLKFRNIVGTSLAPLCGIAIMLFMWFIYHGDDPSATGFYVMSNSNAASESEQLDAMHRLAKLIAALIPFQLLFVFFFGSFIKLLGMLLVVALPIVIDNIISIISEKKKLK